MNTPLDQDQDALDAALDLVGRSGARNLEIGYVREGVPSEEAGWYAHAQYGGVRLIVEEHRGPAEAAEALARRVLTGAKCAHCGGLVALRDDGAMAYPGHLIGMDQLQGIKDAPHAKDGPWDEATIRKAGQCRWRRIGPRWVRGCEGRQAASRSARKGKARKKRRSRR